MYRDLRHRYYCSGMKKHVADFVPRCLTCQQVKVEHQRPTGLLQPLEVAEWKWEQITDGFCDTLAMDIAEARCGVGNSRLAHQVGTFSTYVDDLHIGRIV